LKIQSNRRRLYRRFNKQQKKIFDQLTESITNSSSTQTINGINYGASTSKASDVDEKKKETSVSGNVFNISNCSSWTLNIN